jgi:hypothetical protein
MLPNTDHAPSSGAKTLVRLKVPLLIGLDLVPPPVSILSRPCPVVRTTVPEASVDIYRDPSAGEQDVGATPSPNDGLIYTKSQPAPMQQRSNG